MDPGHQVKPGRDREEEQIDLVRFGKCLDADVSTSYHVKNSNNGVVKDKTKWSPRISFENEAYSSWYPICALDFDNNGATAVCQQMNFSTGNCPSILNP
jgi:hypothetical protein